MQPLALMPKNAHAALPCALRVLRVARAQEALLEVEVLAAHRQRVEQNRKLVWRAVEHRRKRLELLAHPCARASPPWRAPRTPAPPAGSDWAGVNLTEIKKTTLALFWPVGVFVLSFSFPPLVIVVPRTPAARTVPLRQGGRRRRRCDQIEKFEKIVKSKIISIIY